MPTTNIDICNRALILCGSQNSIVTMTQDLLEAKILNGIYAPVVNWCFGIANWNFARTTAALVVSKTLTNPPTTPWTSAEPTPPWKYEYTLPTDIARAQYLTNSDINSNLYLGQPRRCAIVNGSLATNESSAILVYTSNTVSEASWPWYFERLAVTAIALNVVAVLNPMLLEMMQKQLDRIVLISEELNRKEGIIIDDTTPEWIQALGVPYPQRREMQPRGTTSSDNKR